MMYTEKGIEENKKRRRKFNSGLSNAMEKIILGIFLLANIGIMLEIFGFKLENIRLKNKETTNIHQETQVKAIQAATTNIKPINPVQRAEPIESTEPVQQDQKESINNDNYYNTLKNTAKTVQKPLDSYINNYVLREMEEASLKRQQAEQQKNKKPEKTMQITSTTDKKTGTWEECPPYQREGYDYSNAVILCRDGQKIILPLGQRF